MEAQNWVPFLTVTFSKKNLTVYKINFSGLRLLFLSSVFHVEIPLDGEQFLFYRKPKPVVGGHSNGIKIPSNALYFLLQNDIHTYGVALASIYCV